MRSNHMFNEWTRFAVLTGCLGLAALSHSQVITNISKEPAGDGVKLHIDGTDLWKPKILTVYEGKDYILQFAAKLDGGAKKMFVGIAGVGNVSARWYSANPPLVRVLIHKDSAAEPRLEWTDKGYIVDINVPEKAPVAVTAATKAVAKKDVNDGLKPVDMTVLQIPKPTLPVHAKITHEALVSLDFVNTDVVQIMKALALQAGVNIVTAPEVQGRRITVSLDKVRVSDALDFVTALAALRYARVQDSYVVTTRDTFGSIMNDLADRSKKQNVIKIVPLASGDGSGIKVALSRWFGPTTLQVLLPMEANASGVAPAPETTPAAAPAASGDSGAAAPAAAPAAPAASGSAESTSPYVVLIGDAKWVTQAEDLVRKLDADILAARETNKQSQRLITQKQRDEQDRYNEMAVQNKSVGSTQETYEVRNGLADDLKKSLTSQSTFSSVSVVASPKTSRKQVLIVSGQPATVTAAMDVLKQLDTGSSIADTTTVYDIKFADPRSLREDLIANVPGLIVTNPPASAGAPRLFTSGLANSEAQTNTAAAAPGSTAAPANGGSGVKGDTGQVSGLQQPFQDGETTSYPMRLILRGSKEQLEQAMSYLAKVDTAPKQLAIDMRVMELTKEDALKLGINWSVATGGAVKTITLNEAQSGIGANSSPANTIAGHIGGRNWSADVSATLDAITNKNNLISRPNLLAMDGRESEIFVGDVVRYVKSIQSSQNGTTVETDEVPVGVRLAVLPRIGGDGNITMDIRPVVSILKSFTPVPGGGSLPQTSLRISQNTVNVQSGETIAIGGLIQDQDLYNVQKVPLLGDLPILGHLFRQTTHDRVRTEVVFFLTIREVTRDDRKDANDPRVSEQKVKPELPIPVRNLK